MRCVLAAGFGFGQSGGCVDGPRRHGHTCGSKQVRTHSERSLPLRQKRVRGCVCLHACAHKRNCVRVCVCMACSIHVVSLADDGTLRMWDRRTQTCIRVLQPHAVSSWWPWWYACVRACACVCVSVCVSVSASVCVSVCLSVCLSLCGCLLSESVLIKFVLSSQ